MYNYPIGVMLHSFRLPFKEAVKKAAEIGAQGLQLLNTYGELAYNVMDDAKTREVLDVIKSNGLKVSALCGDFGKGFGNPEENPDLIEKSKRVLDLALKLETDVVTTHIGVVPEDPSNPKYKIMQEACGELAEYADSLNAHFAIETGPEMSIVLKGFLDTLHSTGVAVNLDPANLVMVAGDDPVQAVYNLQRYIVHTHAKDGIKICHRDSEIIYGKDRAKEEVSGRAFKELPLGTGGVDFPNYLKALEEVGYRGFLTIEREVGENPAADIKLAADFLRDTIAKN